LGQAGDQVLGGGRKDFSASTIMAGLEIGSNICVHAGPIVSYIHHHAWPGDFHEPLAVPPESEFWGGREPHDWICIVA